MQGLMYQPLVILKYRWNDFNVICFFSYNPPRRCLCFLSKECHSLFWQRKRHRVKQIFFCTRHRQSPRNWCYCNWGSGWAIRFLRIEWAFPNIFVVVWIAFFPMMFFPTISVLRFFRYFPFSRLFSVPFPSSLLLHTRHDRLQIKCS